MYVAPAGNVSVTVTLPAVPVPLFVAVTVYVSVPPTAILAGPVTTTDRSALPVTVVDVDAELFAVFGSGVVPVTVTESLAVPPYGGAFVVIVITGTVPTANVVAVQVTRLPVCVQDQPVPVALTNVAPVGSVSRTVVAPASSGPVFETVTV